MTFAESAENTAQSARWRVTLAAALLLGMTAAGCGGGKIFNGSAKAPDGGRYVVGQNGDRAAVWWCKKENRRCKRMRLRIKRAE